jgi:hypothetical protein
MMLLASFASSLGFCVLLLFLVLILVDNEALPYSLLFLCVLFLLLGAVIGDRIDFITLTLFFLLSGHRIVFVNVGRGVHGVCR